MWEILKLVSNLASSLDCSLYLVGGTIRDKLLGHDPQDIDLAVSGSCQSLAELLAKELQGTVVLMDQERETVRVVVQPNIQIDLSLLKGNCIERDLLTRDFTINALAIKLSDFNNEWINKVIDPLGGLQDIKLGLLRAVSNSSLLDDPLRFYGEFAWLPATICPYFPLPVY
ncbi:hypothetical protein N752_22705 [Desulforamulus aquiferis]|nr:hypothetical protein [Desulforamulus aquiferis]RYD02828.1 hypothetical protein N752_22705 [Desulforamulus aquiferis]